MVEGDATCEKVILFEAFVCGFDTLDSIDPSISDSILAFTPCLF